MSVLARKVFHTWVAVGLSFGLLACPPPSEDDAGSSGRDAGSSNSDASQSDATSQSDAPSQSDATGADTGGDAGGSSCLLENQLDGEDISQNKTLTKACSPYTVDHRIKVVQNATLTIEPGVELRFAADQWLEVGGNGAGTLVADGTAADPIIFTSSQPQPTPGSWVGIVLEDEVLAGTSISHAEIRHGGQDYWASSHQGCLSINSNIPERVSVQNVRFLSCAQAGVTAIDEGFRFAAFSANSFDDLEAGMWLTATALGSVAGDQSYSSTDRNLIEGGTVVDSATWLTQGVPWDALDRIKVEGNNNPQLTIEAGAHFRFPASTWLVVGDNAGGSLVVEGTAAAPVVFESDANQTTAGSWVGLVFASSVGSGTRLSYTIIRDAGEDYWSSSHDGCLSINSQQAGRVSIDHSRFENCDQAGVAAREVDFAFVDFAENTVADAPVGLWLHPGVVDSIAAGQTFESVTHNVIDGGAVIMDATWLAQSIPYSILDPVKVGNDTNQPVLTLAQGLDLRFAEDTWLSVGENEVGGIIIAGVSADPVTLQSSHPAPTPGSWVGLWIDDMALAGSSLNYANIRDGGADYWSSSHDGCLSVTTSQPGRLAVTNSSFSNCAQASVAAHSEGFAFTTFSTNSMEDSPIGLWLHPTAVGSIDEDLTYSSTPKNQIDGGDVVETATWLPQAVPYHVEDSIRVGDDVNQPVLTLNAGLTLAFGQNTWLSTGESEAGSLIVAGDSTTAVTFMSSEPSATAGSWVGLWFDDATLAGTVVDYAVIQDAGEAYWSSSHRGGITIDSAAGRVTVSNSSFNNNDQADIWVGCETAPTLNNNGSAVVVYEDNC